MCFKWEFSYCRKCCAIVTDWLVLNSTFVFAPNLALVETKQVEARNVWIRTSELYKKPNFSTFRRVSLHGSRSSEYKLGKCFHTLCVRVNRGHCGPAVKTLVGRHLTPPPPFPHSRGSAADSWRYSTNYNIVTIFNLRIREDWTELRIINSLNCFY